MTDELPSLSPRYRVLRELARGGMGRVLLAQDTWLDRPVAVKTTLSPNHVILQRFFEEAQITGQLAHPNIVPVHELGGEPQRPFLVMKLVEGRTLLELGKELGKGGPVPEEARPRLLRLFLKVCDAVAYAHGRQVLHRDLKPANVMIGEGDEVLVMDWGLARPLRGAGAAPEAPLPTGAVVSESRTSGQLTQAGSVVGTPAYMPPEQAEGIEELDLRADVYSLGAMLYELLCGRPPFEGKSYEVMMQLLRQAPPAPRTLVPDLPAPMEAIVLKAMARDRRERYADAAELAADVARLLDADAVQAYSESPWEALRRLIVRHRVASLTAVVTLLVLFGLGASATAVVHREGLRLEAESERARAAAAEAGEEGGRVAKARARVERLTTAVQLAGEGLEQVEVLRRQLEALPPLEEGQPRPSLEACYRQSVERLERLAQGVGALAVEEEDGAALAPFREELAQARVALACLLADALLDRAPAALLVRLEGGLELGPEEPLYRARALLRVERPEQASQVLAAARFPGARTDLQAAARALRARLERAPAAEEEVAWRDAIALSPARAWLHLRLAECRARRGDFAAAELGYDRATQLDRLDAWAYVSRILHTYPVFSIDSPGEQTSRLLATLGAAELSHGVFVARAGLWGGGNWSRLCERLEPLERERPALARRWRAESALILQRWEDARRDAEAVLAEVADDTLALGVLATALLELGDPAGAGRACQQGLALAPEEGRLNWIQGRLLLAADRAAEARPHLELAAKPALDHEPWLDLARCCLSQGGAADLERGVEAACRGEQLSLGAGFYQVAAARPVLKDPRLDRVLGHLRRAQGRLGEATVHYVRALLHAQYPKVVEALGLNLEDALHAGDVQLELGLPQEAALLWRQAERDPALAGQVAERLNRQRRR